MWDDFLRRQRDVRTLFWLSFALLGLAVLAFVLCPSVTLVAFVHLEAFWFVAWTIHMELHYEIRAALREQARKQRDDVTS